MLASQGSGSIHNLDGAWSIKQRVVGDKSEGRTCPVRPVSGGLAWGVTLGPFSVSTFRQSEIAVFPYF